MSTARINTSFKKDAETYGPIGEMWLIEKLKSSPKTKEIADVSKIESMQKLDIDIIQIKNSCKESLSMEDIIDGIANGKTFSPNIATSYEVKTDTQVVKTRNIAYEVMSHTNPGCFARTMADYIVYTGIDDNNKVVEAYLLETKKLRQYVLENFSSINKNEGIRSFFMNHEYDKTAIFLINIDKLIKEKVAINIF